MYNRDTVQMEVRSQKVEGIWQEAQKLSAPEKAELVRMLLRKDSGLVVVSQHTRLADYMIAQMSLLSSEGLTQVARAIAQRIDSEAQSARS